MNIIPYRVIINKILVYYCYSVKNNIYILNLYGYFSKDITRKIFLLFMNIKFIKKPNRYYNRNIKIKYGFPKKLNKLVLENINKIKVIHGFNLLKELIINNCVELKEIKNLPKLRYLYINECGLIHQLNNLPILEKLSIIMDKNTGYNLRRIKGLIHLKYLNIKGCHYFHVVDASAVKKLIIESSRIYCLLISPKILKDLYINQVTIVLIKPSLRSFRNVEKTNIKNLSIYDHTTGGYFDNISE